MKYIQQTQDIVQIAKDFFDDVNLFYKLIFYYFQKFEPNEKKGKMEIIQLLTEFLEFLLKCKKEKNANAKAIELIKKPTEKLQSLLMNTMAIDISQILIQPDLYTIFLQELEREAPILLNFNEPHQQQALAFNVYNFARRENLDFSYENLENEMKIKNLICMRKVQAREFPFREKTLVNGIMEFVTLYVSKCICAKKNLVCINYSLRNNSEVEIKSLELKLNMPEGVDSISEEENPSTASYQEVAPNSVKMGQFVVGIKEAKIMNFIIDMKMECDGEDSISYQSLPIMLEISNFFVPHTLGLCAASLFETYWEKLYYQITIEANLNGARQDIVKWLEGNPNFEVIYFERKIWKEYTKKEKEEKKNEAKDPLEEAFCGIIGYMWDGASLALKLIPKKIEKSMKMNVCIRTDTSQLLRNISENQDFFLHDFFSDLISF